MVEPIDVLEVEGATASEVELVSESTAVNKALCAVSYLVDHGYRVIFDRDDKTGVDTSHILNKSTGRSIRMNREKNVWTIGAFIDELDPKSGFARQG